MKVTRPIAVVATLAISTSAFALPAYLKVFQGSYPVPKNSKLAKASCATCHVGMSSKLNPYGRDIQVAMKAAKTKGLSRNILKSVENLDSDKDHVKNIVEIKKGTLPGDPKSK